MSKSTQQKNIEGQVCLVVQYPGMEGLRIWTNLVKILGPSVATLGKGVGDGIKDIKNADSVVELLDSQIDMDKLFSTMSEALVMATDRIDEDIIEQLTLRILASTKIDNQEIDINSFNILFSGNYGLLFRVVAFTLQVNYSSFLGGKGHSTDTNPNPSLSSVPA